MSSNNPQTLEEWKLFRFPVDETLRPGMPGFVAMPPIPTAPEPPVDEGEESDGKGKGRGSQGSGGLVPTIKVASSAIVLEKTAPEKPAPGRRAGQPPAPPKGLPSKPTASATPVARPASLPTPSDEGTSELAAESTLPDQDLPEVSERVGSWTYDAARGLLINWSNERMVSLPRHLNTLPMILRHLAIVEARHMDHLGFIQALNRACEDVHGKTLRQLIRSLPKGSDQPIGWGDLPSEKLALSPARRRGMGV